MLIIDIKTGKKADWHKYQVAAYFELAKKGDTNIEFNPETHQYLRNKIEIPNVTTILKIIQDWNYGGNSEAADKGTYIHKCTALSDKNLLDFYSLDINIQNYVACWENFVFDELNLHKNNAIIEQKYYYEKLGYKFSGTVDRVYPNYVENQMWIVYLSPNGCDIERVKAKEQKQLFMDFLCILRTFNIKNKW